jgi:hypothetical protein
MFGRIYEGATDVYAGQRVRAQVYALGATSLVGFVVIHES